MAAATVATAPMSVSEGHDETELHVAIRESKYAIMEDMIPRGDDIDAKEAASASAADAFASAADASASSAAASASSAAASASAAAASASAAAASAAAASSAVGKSTRVAPSAEALEMIRNPPTYTLICRYMRLVTK
jgi:hypothetical protein